MKLQKRAASSRIRTRRHSRHVHAAFGAWNSLTLEKLLEHSHHMLRQELEFNQQQVMDLKQQLQDTQQERTSLRQQFNECMQERNSVQRLVAAQVRMLSERT